MIHQKPLLGTPLDLAHPINNGLVGYWLMNEGSGNLVKDLSLNNGDGTVDGMTWDGVRLTSPDANDGIVLPTNYKPLDGASSLTVIARVMASSLSADGGIFYTDVHTAGDGLFLYFDASTTNHFGAWITAGSSSGSKYSKFETIVNTWYTVALTWDGATVRMYIDGVEDTGSNYPFSMTGSLIGTDTSYTIANDSRLNTKGLSGKIDTFALYSRALSAQEIQSLYLNPYQGFKESNLIQWAGTIGGVTPATAYPWHYYNRMRA